MTPEPDETPRDKIIVQGDPDLQELIPGFLENRRKDVAILIAANDRGDFQAIQALGHRLKGDGGGYGFDGLSAIGYALEQAAQERNQETVRSRVAELSSYLSRVEVIYGAS
ncbi:MAG: Hpt domain-containing protein [Nitrospirae bacterium]|nr:MAG: Hpt domain-containing protein [Nitrospirota bacterium]